MNSEVTFIDRLRAVMRGEDYTPWARRHGISPVTVHGWLNGANLYPKSWDKLVNATGIPKDWWNDGDLTTISQSPHPNTQIVTDDGGASGRLFLTPEPQRKANIEASQTKYDYTKQSGIDKDKLQLAIEIIEEALDGSNNTMTPIKKAEMVLAVYDLVATGVSKAQVLTLVKLAA